MNKIILMGNVGKDPEIKNLDNGNTVANLTLAVNEKWRDKEGNLQSNTIWYDLECWGNKAKVVEKYVKKGDKLLIEGRGKFDEWENEAGEKRSKFKVRADSITMLGGKSKDSGNGTPPEDDLDGLPF